MNFGSLSFVDSTKRLSPRAVHQTRSSPAPEFGECLFRSAAVFLPGIERIPTPEAVFRPSLQILAAL